MNTLKQLILLIIFLMVTGCATIGPTIVIETPEPAEDFVVLCNKTKSYFIGHNASGYDVVDKVFVAKSGEEVDCGLLIGGSAAGASILHPIYTGDGKENYTKDDIKHIVMNKTKLDILDELKTKFEAGHWDKYKNPGAEYLKSLPGCGFPYQYLDYYKESKEIDLNHFKKAYAYDIFECHKRRYSLLEKYDPYTFSKIPKLEERMDLLWSDKQWSNYQ